jgi:hypothetical protein
MGGDGSGLGIQIQQFKNRALVKGRVVCRRTEVERELALDLFWSRARARLLHEDC